MNPRLQCVFSRCTAWLLVWALVCLGAGCGVGQDGTGAAPDTQATGVVTGFGSVIVDGVPFDISGAEIAIDGTTGGTQADLRVGMVVTVSGTLAADGNSGSATGVVYESLLRGTLDSVPDGTTLFVLGQRINVDATTLFEGTGVVSAADLQPGVRLQLSGFHQADGFRATWVRVEAGAVTPQLSGFVAAVNLNANVVRLAGLDVNIGNAELVGVTRNALAAGQLVRVTLQNAPSSGTAVATQLRLLGDGLLGPLRRLLLHGLVRQWNPTTGTFVMNRQLVQLQTATPIDGGTFGDIGPGARVRVIGSRGADGVLVADRVHVYRPAIDGYVRGRVSQVDLAARQITLGVAPGVQIQVLPGTVLSDLTFAGGGLTLADLRPNDALLALGWINTAGQIDAGLVQRVPLLTPGAGIGGPVAAIGTDMFTILGRLVTTTNTTQFFSAQGQAQTAAAFFAALQPGDLVRAEGVLNSAALAASSVRRVP